MIRFFLRHPIGVLTTFAGLLAFSFVAFPLIPVSLLPGVEIPRINVYFEYPNASPIQMEKQVLEAARARLSTLSHLKELFTIAENSIGKVELSYEHGTDMKLAYIEASELIDRMTEVLPHDLPRPLVSRTSTSDIPLVRMQIVPRVPAADFALFSESVEKVIRRRLEQLEGVSLVDVNGLKKKAIYISPKLSALKAHHISSDAIEQAISDYNQPLGSMSVKDGIYRYYIQLEATLHGLKEVQEIPVRLPGGLHVPLKELAEINSSVIEPRGYHLFNGREGFVITIHKQEEANMFAVRQKIEQAMPRLQADFPDFQFSLSQDQSALLQASIGNLTSSLLYGGIFAFLVLFIFMGNARIPLIMGISIPVSLALSFLFFYLLRISINIISLSGLALGVGVMVDNAIVIIDNITKGQGAGSTKAIAKAVNEMFAPLLSAVLTTLVVFIPLIFISGTTGALFYDQAMAVTIILGVSLLVSFILVPVVFKALIPKPVEGARLHTPVFRQVSGWYEAVFNRIMHRPQLIWVASLGLLIGGVWVGATIKKENLPAMLQDDFLMTIEWNEPITPQDNKKRCEALSQFIQKEGIVEIEAGLSTLLLKKEKESINSAILYFKGSGSSPLHEVKAAMGQWLSHRFPAATAQFRGSPNAFSQTFDSPKKYWEVHFKNTTADLPLAPHRLDSLEALLQGAVPGLQSGLSNELTSSLEISLQYDRIFLYNIDPAAILNELKRWIGTVSITDIKNIGESIPIFFKSPSADFKKLISTLQVTNHEGINYPLSLFINVKEAQEYKAIFGGKTGLYHQFYTENTTFNHEQVRKQLQEKPAGGLAWSFEGTLFDNHALFAELTFILATSFLLLYFILAAQFESLWKPFLVIFTLPLGIAGSLLFLWVGGQSFNIMAGIGIIVMLGVMVNDAILKVDTINKLLRPKPVTSKEAFINVLHEAGLTRLKPILMTTLTTVLALVPILFSSGLGADLQKPFVWALAGGLITGTLTALWLVPVLYFGAFRAGRYFRSLSS